MSASYITTGFRAVWSALKTGSNVAAHMASKKGQYYEETETSKPALKITRSDCPAIIMVPGVSAISIAPANNMTFDVSIPLNFDLREENMDVGAALNLWEMLVRDLWAAWKANAFGCASLGLYQVKPGSAQVRKVYDQSESALVFVSWQVEWPLTLVFRRDLAAA
ncbi:MAG TPA: hypothetical protein P5137_04145 [Candidatus Brocadiia bacterium]|nr:hypothetical protein [Candidatus Brocadiia bacterium]